MFQSLLSKKIVVPMNQMGGNVHEVISNKLSMFEGKCVEEGYVKPKSSKLFSYSCGKVKKNEVVIHVVFECEIVNPVAGQLMECKVENNTKAGITARVKDQSCVVFLARDHHNTDPTFSKIKENETIRVKVIGQRYEVGDPTIYVIAILEKI